MKGLGKQIEDLIAQKKEKSKLPIEEKQKIVSSVDDAIASKEKSIELDKTKLETQKPKQLKDLISFKKEENKLSIKEKQKNIFSIEAIIASKEESAKLARQKLKNKSTALNKIDNNLSLKKVNNVSTNENDKGVNIKKIIDKSVSFISKKDIISKLRYTKSGHKQRVANIHVLTRTGDIDEIKATMPKSFAVCDFGKWYYGEGQMLAEFKEYQNLEKVHQKIHDIYLQISNLYKNKIVGSLFNSGKKQLKERENKTVLLAKNLDYQSNLFSEKLLLLEEIVKNLSNEKMAYLNI